ncbi:MAG TPA: dienelactone hydrolase family protein [Ornithinibacter sp.]|nr:dienelactone hydrolase family protein [Ornithinibacter sp.]
MSRPSGGRRARDGGGAALRGHVPPAPSGVVLLLHGGAESSLSPVRWWSTSVLRMVPFASAIRSRAGDDLAVLRLRDRVRGWNGSRQDPVVDARWALGSVMRDLPGLPIAVVGHSMGGRVALEVAGDAGVTAVAALAPWIEGHPAPPRAATPVLLMHGSNDRITSARRTSALAGRWADAGVDVRHVRVQPGDHPMLREAARWHDTVADFVIEALLGPGRTS